MSQDKPTISREQAEDAVRVLLRYAGEAPAREGRYVLRNYEMVAGSDADID